ncbi:MAG: pre-16S rRNA-processing nuclease YqgF [Armatimonadetes bacterium]|nr:pre-16S rRNA-processing nuclease YqgF [Armatimonadota bacterium]
MVLPTRTVLAVDPGSSKCGLAIVHRDDKGKMSLLWRTICPLVELTPAINLAYADHPFDLVIIGSSTGSREVTRIVKEAFPSISTLLVDERETTLRAREKYWEHHQRGGWRRLLPASLQVPPEPVDDFAALVIAERVLDAS